MTTTVALIIFILLVIILWWALSRMAETHKTDVEIHHEEPKEAEPAIEAPVRAEPVVADDLTVLEGIGPKINGLLQGAGIQSFAQLAAADMAQVKALLEANGLQFIDPSSWREQAGLAAEGRMDELQALQGRLRGGRKVG